MSENHCFSGFSLFLEKCQDLHEPLGLDGVWKLKLSEKHERDPFIDPFMDHHMTPLFFVFSRPGKKCQKDPCLRLGWRESDQNAVNKTPQLTPLEPPQLAPLEPPLDHHWNHHWTLTGPSLDQTWPDMSKTWPDMSKTWPDMSKTRKSAKFSENPEKCKIQWKSRKQWKCIKTREIEVPDPYHGVALVIDRLPVPHYPGYPPVPQCPCWPCTRVQHVSQRPTTVHQASSGYSHRVKIPTCLKTNISERQKPTCQNCHFWPKSLPNPHNFLQNCCFWRFWRKTLFLDTFRRHH